MLYLFSEERCIVCGGRIWEDHISRERKGYWLATETNSLLERLLIGISFSYKVHFSCFESRGHFKKVGEKRKQELKEMLSAFPFLKNANNKKEFQAMALDILKRPLIAYCMLGV